MLHQTKIRKTALCLIYAMMEQGYAEQDFPYENFWNITLEKENDHLRRALAKGILHAGRSAAEVAGAFLERGEALLLDAKGDISLLSLRDEVERIVERSKALLSSCNELRLCLHDKRRDSSDPLEDACKKTLQLVHAVAGLGEALMPRLEDEARQVAGPLRRWLRLLGECDRLSDPAHLEDAKEYAGLAHKAKELAELRPAAETLAKEVLARREEWEDALQKLLRNYVPERLDVVDKGILYLSLYELRCRKLNAPIAIAEAINLAHEFSGAKSAPFIHGVLATAALETNAPS